MTTPSPIDAYRSSTLHAEQAATFTTLYTNYSSALLSVLIRLVHDHQQAEDLLQDAFVKVWMHLHEYDPAQGRPYTWLLTITRHVALDDLRARKVQNQALTYLCEPIGAWTLPAFHDGLVNGSIFALLPPKYQQIVDLTYRQGWTQPEIAQALNVPLGTIKTRTRTALRVLKQLFSQDIAYYLPA